MKNLEAVPEVDYARLAAYIDGEGCIRLQPSGYKRRNRFYTVNVIIAQADQRLITWLYDTFGGSTNVGVGKYRAMYYWKLGAQALDYVLVRCLPYLLVKAEQARVALEYRATVTDRTITLPQELIDRREELRLRLHDLKHGHKKTKLTEA